jgi:ABC-type lipoprotein export system ATPase subunit
LTAVTPLLETHSLAFATNRTARAPTRMDFPDLSIAPAEIVGVLGPSGSGKSTLMCLLAGLVRPSSGHITRTPADLVAWGSLTFVSQAALLVPELTVSENIALGAGALFVPSDEATREAQRTVAAAVDVDRFLDRRIDELSVGERQRVTIARAMIARPRCVLADEPVAHQDGEHAESVLRLLASAIDDGGACVIFSRDPEVVGIAHRSIRLPVGVSANGQE